MTNAPSHAHLTAAANAFKDRSALNRAPKQGLNIMKRKLADPFVPPERLLLGPGPSPVPRKCLPPWPIRPSGISIPHSSG